MNERLLSSLLPDFVDVLAHALSSDGMAKQAEQLKSLYVFDRCRCDDGGCATLYTVETMHHA